MNTQPSYTCRNYGNATYSEGHKKDTYGVLEPTVIKTPWGRCRDCSAEISAQVRH